MKIKILTVIAIMALAAPLFAEEPCLSGLCAGMTMGHGPGSDDVFVVCEEEGGLYSFVQNDKDGVYVYRKNRLMGKLFNMVRTVGSSYWNRDVDYVSRAEFYKNISLNSQDSAVSNAFKITGHDGTTNNVYTRLISTVLRHMTMEIPYSRVSGEIHWDPDDITGEGTFYLHMPEHLGLTPVRIPVTCIAASRENFERERGYRNNRDYKRIAKLDDFLQKLVQIEEEGERRCSRINELECLRISDWQSMRICEEGIPARQAACLDELKSDKVELFDKTFFLFPWSPPDLVFDDGSMTQAYPIQSICLDEPANCQWPEGEYSGERRSP